MEPISRLSICARFPRRHLLLLMAVTNSWRLHDLLLENGFYPLMGTVHQHEGAGDRGASAGKHVRVVLRRERGGLAMTDPSCRDCMYQTGESPAMCALHNTSTDYARMMWFRDRSNTIPSEENCGPAGKFWQARTA